MFSRETALLRRFTALLNHGTYMFSGETAQLRPCVALVRSFTALLSRFGALLNRRTYLFSGKTALLLRLQFSAPRARNVKAWADGPGHDP
jgi:hypothetical protein